MPRRGTKRKVPDDPSADEAMQWKARAEAAQAAREAAEREAAAARQSVSRAIAESVVGFLGIELAPRPPPESGGGGTTGGSEGGGTTTTGSGGGGTTTTGSGGGGTTTTGSRGGGTTTTGSRGGGTTTTGSRGGGTTTGSRGRDPTTGHRPEPEPEPIREPPPPPPLEPQFVRARDVLNVVYDPKVDEVLGWNSWLFMANLFLIGFLFTVSVLPPAAWQWLKQCSKEKKSDVVTQADFLAYGSYVICMIIVVFVVVTFVLGYVYAWAKMRHRNLNGILVDHLTIMNIISIVAIFIGLYDIWLHPYLMQAGQNNGFMKMGYSVVNGIGGAFSGAWRSVLG
jgi:hypothetical protein